MVSSRPALISDRLRVLAPYWRALSTQLARVDDGVGLPSASSLERKAGQLLALLASVWFALVAFWEIGAPFGAGHYAASTAVALGGENMLRFHTLLPVTDHPLGTPTSADCYCHHPFGVFWSSAAFVGLLGHHDFVCRLPAALLSSLTPPLLYALGRSLWSPVAGGVAAVAFSLTPIALAFANFNALEVPTIFGMLLACLAYVRFWQSGRRRFVVVCAAALLYAANSDFPGLVFGAELLALCFVRLFLLGGGVDAQRFRRGASLFAWGVVLLALLCVSYLAVFVHAGKLDELLQQARLRSVGNQLPLDRILESRSYWIALMFTPLGVALGKLGAFVSAVRTAVRKSELELLPLALLGVALFQYLVFAQGADVHVFWPHYFAPCYALGLAATAQSLMGVIAMLRPRRRELLLLPFGAALLTPLAMARDAVATLVYARKTGGRFNEKGRFIQPDKDKVAALSFLNDYAEPGAVVTLNLNMKKSLWVPWVLDHPTKIDGASQFRGNERYYVTDGRFSEGTQLRDYASRSHSNVVGPFWLFETRGFEPLRGYAIVRREPNLLERYFVSSTHALRTVEPDDYVRWERRDMLSQYPNPPPAAPPRGFEQLRIAYNIAQQQGDSARAKQLRSQLLAGSDASVATEYADGTKLLAVRFESGASDVLSVYFESTGPDDQRFVIRSRVEEKLAGSLVPADTLESEVGLPTTIPRNAWRAGYLYSSITELLHRPGRERFAGSWVNTSVSTLPLRSKDGKKDVTLLVLP
ncbi:MAG: glycosyltransferase family 39 protein [Polyangiaceae bacterium]